MKTETNHSVVRSHNLGRIMLVTLLILMVPFIAMRFTDEVNWGAGDFIIAGGLLMGTGFLYELVANRLPKRTYRVAVGVTLGLILLAVWAELAVGILS